MSTFDSIRFQPSRPLLKEVSADRLNAILSEIKKNRPRGEHGITVRQAGDFTYIGLASNAAQQQSVLPVVHPWDIYIEKTTGKGESITYEVKVRPGTLNGILPANWNQTFTCRKNGLYYAKAVVATDGEEIIGLNIVIDQAPPEIQQPQEFAIAKKVDYLFGLFSEGNVYRTIANGHILLYPTVWLVKDKESPARPGELPYAVWYTLQ